MEKDEYKQDIIKMIEQIDNLCVLKLISKFIISVKKKWGI